MKIDAIFDNGRIRTMDGQRPAATRLGVLNGRIVGFDEELEGVTAERTVDLGGAAVLPGFHDAHYHASLTGARLASLDLRPGVIDSLDELYVAVRERAAGLGPNEWIRGSGYDQNIIGGHPTARALDQVSGGRPVLLEHVSGHMIVANTEAFTRAGYPGGYGVPEVDGGHVARTPDGRAEGLLQEQANRLIYAVVRPMALEEVQRNLALASHQAVSFGLTSLTEPGLAAWETIGNSPVDFHSYQVASETGVLKPRMTLMPYVTTLHNVPGFKDRDWYGLDLGIRTGFGGDRLKMGPVKIVSDGSFIGRSAAMHHCYHGEPENKGFMQFDPDALKRMIVGVHKAGWTVATHAIGDAAMDHAMDGIDEAQRQLPRPGVRHRIEHFALASDAQIQRAAALGIIPVPQGTFISDFGDGMMAAVEPELQNRIYRMKSLLNAGIVLPGSTDSPVSNGNPLRSIHDMVNRTTASGQVLAPAERLTVAEAVRAYTYGSAYAVNEEHNKGTLSRGLLADFVVLSEDLFGIDPAGIRDVTVRTTVIGGEVVYNDGDLPAPGATTQVDPIAAHRL
ncbi:amidohydrolase [Specibacter cremeus]|uniref:amidohydrolase n=1 Tax=Specibacter cremeus TaxID=1629051 RepID=UPI000F782206|nr:amidohydrolase [Specibacter cremeus]